MANVDSLIHVLHVVRRGFAGGGMENGIVNVANRLPDDRFRVSICALDSMETFSERMHRPDSQYYLVPKQGDGVDWKLIWKLACVVRRSKANVVHSHNWGTFLYAVLASKLAGVPVIHGEHGKTEADLRPEGQLKHAIKSWLGRQVDLLTTVNQALAREWQEYGVQQEKIRWIPNGVDTDRFRPCADRAHPRRDFDVPEDAVLIGGIGRLDRLKNFEVVINALPALSAEFPRVHFALLGEGPCRQRMTERAATLGLSGRVSFLGWRSDPERFLSALDIFVLPSKYEGMSNVLLEAMASGLPVVCADLPCHNEVFKPNVEGLTVSPCTPDELARTIIEVIRSREWFAQLQTAARQKVLARFSLGTMVSDYGRAYEEVYSRRATMGRLVSN